MNLKKLIILSILVLLLIGCINSASAGWFDSKKDTEIVIEHNGNLLTVKLIDNQTKEKIDLSYGQHIQVNVTDISTDGLSGSDLEAAALNRETKTYDVSWDAGSNHNVLEVCELNPGQYSISATFEGDNEYNACNESTSVVIF